MADELAMLAGDDASWHTMREAIIAWAAASPTQKNGQSAAVWAVHEIQSVFVENEPKSEEERVAQCILFHEIFGNPFQPVALNPAWLAWNDGTVRKIAQSIYDERAFDRLPILADALTGRRLRQRRHPEPLPL